MSATQATANAPVQILLQPLRAGLCVGTTQQFEVLVPLQAADLHGGWVHCADSLTDVAGEGLKRVILLSDGCANEGVTDTANDLIGNRSLSGYQGLAPHPYCFAWYAWRQCHRRRSHSRNGPH